MMLYNAREINIYDKSVFVV